MKRVGEMCDFILKHFKYIGMKGKKSYMQLQEIKFP